MLAASFKRTKIVASIGPATHSYDAIKHLVLAGANCIRLNMSHDVHEFHAQRIAWARQVSKDLGKPVSVLVDLQGPKIRVGELPEEGIQLVTGSTVHLAYGADYETDGMIPIQFDFSGKMKKGEVIYLYDGRLAAEVMKVSGKVITAKVTAGGLLKKRKGINLPDTDFSGDILTEKDIADLKFAVEQDADFIGFSFVQTPEDIEDLRSRLKKHKSHAAIIAKIETKAAVKHLEAIVASSDGVMVARGDLAVEVLPEQVPVIQKHIVDLGQKHQKPVIVATQMMMSMIDSPQPTRAEVSDVATAVMQGADAVMLSEETTVGEFPIETVAMMKRVIVYTQSIMPPASTVPAIGDKNPASAISAAAITLARQIDAKVIIAETSTGKTARNLASFRPPMPIIMVTNNPKTYQQLPIVWGGKSYFLPKAHGASKTIIEMLKAAGNVHEGDLIVVARGNQPGVPGNTDTIEVKAVS